MILHHSVMLNPIIIFDRIFFDNSLTLGFNGSLVVNFCNNRNESRHEKESIIKNRKNPAEKIDCFTFRLVDLHDYMVTYLFYFRLFDME
jgi:hypothetical protein